MIENCFVDFQTYRLNEQFDEIYGSLYNAYRRSEKPTLNRSLSSGMLEYNMSLIKEKRPNPYFKQINNMKFLQARIYAN